jgi:cholesterol transport system auxiliary component
MSGALSRTAKRLAVVLAAGLLAGCISIGPGDPTPLTWYELSAAPPAETAPRTVPSGLWVDAVPGSEFYEAASIAFSRAPGQRAYYRFASWTEPVANRLARLVERDLRARKAFLDVATIGDGARADLYLRLVVDDFFHDAVVEPGTVRVAFSAELVDTASRRRIARKEFRRAAPVAEANAASAVAAFDVAVAGALEELAAWLANVSAP